MKLVIIFLLFTGAPFAYAEDWTATDGTVYKSVTVLSHDAGYVTIIDSDGGGKIPLRLLNAELQKKFGYDAAKAAACEAATEAQDKADRLAVAKEEEAADAAKQKQLIAESTPTAAQPQATSATSVPAPVDQISEARKQDIRDTIASLQSDIDRMTSEQQRDAALVAGHAISHGGLSDKIAEDRQQISELQQQLNQ
jgi:hypothetical protein